MRELNITIKEICALVEGKMSLDHLSEQKVKRIASLEHASELDFAVVFDPENNSVFAPLSLKKVEKSCARIILASKEIVPGKSYIIVKDPLVALKKLVDFIDARETRCKLGVSKDAFVGEFAVIEDEVSVGPSAVILDDANVGYGTHVGATSFIGKGCKVGSYVKIHPGAKILDYCIIGDHSIIHSGAVVGSDGFGYRVMKQGLEKIPHIGIVRIGKHVEIGANTCIDRADFEETVIGDGVKMDNCVHIAHNVKIGPCTAILAQTCIGGSAVVGVGCQIGGQVAIKDHVTIGNGVKIVSKSAVMKNIGDGEVVCGVPSMPFIQWKRMMVAMVKLPEYLKDFKKIKAHFEEKRKGGFWRQILSG